MAAVEDEQPSSSCTTFSKEEVNKLMSQGKRHFVCDEIVEAVKCFEAACLMLNKEYGAVSNECGEAHFQYGKSLLELARLEGGVLGSALNEAVEQELSESDEDNMVTGDTPAAGSVENNTANKQPTIAETSDANGETKRNEGTAKESAEKVGTSAEEKREGSETERKEDTIEEEKMETAEEKPTNMESRESGEKKVEENITEENKMDNSNSDCKDTTTGEQAQYNSKDVGEEVDVSNKENISEEHKEIDENENKKEDAKVDDNKKSENLNDEDEDNKNEDVNDDESENVDGPVSTIQLAWETLELARIIFKRHSSREMQLKLAQTHLLLGEIHMEQEQFSDAISELTKCLNIQKNLLEPDDRLLAETYYNLGLGYTLSMMYEESANHYGNATEVLELRVKNIKARIEEAEHRDKGKNKASDDDPVIKDRKEITEIEELLPEVREKHLDAKNEGERLKSNIAELKLGLQSIVGSSSSMCSTSCSDKPANDISHLVRKKRKPKDEEENPDAPAKKPRQEETSLEGGSTMLTENGDSTMTETTDVQAQS